MKVFRGFKTKFDIVGNDNDVYFQMLPAHDLSGLSNFLVKVCKHTNYKTIFDVGANIGLSSLLITEVYPSAHTFAFEPSPKTYKYLVENLESNYATGFVTPVCSAVGGAGGSVYFHDDQHCSAGNHISRSDTGISVPVVTIDDFVQSRGISRVDFIKIDTEGFESSVLEGAAATLFHFKPTVLLEYNRYVIENIAGGDPVDVLAIWMAHLGILGVIDPPTGNVTMLPRSAPQAFDWLNARYPSQFDVLDLVNYGCLH